MKMFLLRFLGGFQNDAIILIPDYLDSLLTKSDILLTTVSDWGTTELLAMKKRDKNSMKFSIMRSEGLSGNLGGIVGENLIPHEYHVDDNGNIQLKNRIIDSNMVHFSKEDECFKIRRVFKLALTRNGIVILSRQRGDFYHHLENFSKRIGIGNLSGTQTKRFHFEITI